MPVCVQWKWINRTKSFLVIFHFIDDSSRPNLRMSKEYSNLMTWAPSHVELGLLSEILKFANIINGLSASQKSELKYKLQGVNKVGEGSITKYMVIEDLERLWCRTCLWRENKRTLFLSPIKSSIYRLSWKSIGTIC